MARRNTVRRHSRRHLGGGRCHAEWYVSRRITDVTLVLPSTGAMLNWQIKVTIKAVRTVGECL